MSHRSTEDVFYSHLRYRENGDIEGDLKHNYSEDVIVLCEFGVLRGYDGVRKSAKRLEDQLPNPRFEFITELVESNYAFLVWRAKSDRLSVPMGADSFVIRDGKIIMQSIFYQIESWPDDC